MSASGGRCRRGDRFYTPPALRRQLLLQHQQLLKQVEDLDIQNEKEKDKQQRSQRPAPIQRTKSVAESDDCASSTTATTTATTPRASVASHVVSDGGLLLPNLTNLERFLEYTTPSVQGQRFSKSSMRRCRAKEEGIQPYFVLGDLWESFHEWSAYGAGVPLLLNGSDSVVQYYAPYLSGIQLYIDPSLNTPRSRRLGEDSDVDSSRGSSGCSSDYETENGANGFLQGVQSRLDLIEASRNGIKGPMGSSSDEGESASFPGLLKFEYFEYDTPYNREPLTDKISILASRFPELRTYRSCDLSPGSWISVAWYPIYRIPMGPTLKNLDSCFLTFHSLSTPVHGSQCSNGAVPREFRQGYDMNLKLSLPIFGLASLKFNASFWEQTGTADVCQKADTLSRKADDWLQLLSVNHPDYRFFASHNYWR